MAIAPTGTKQKTYYVREDLAKVIAHIASDEDKRESDVVNDAFDYYINIKLTEEQRRVFGYKKEQKNENANGTNGVATGQAVQRAATRAVDTGGEAQGEAGSPPGRKKRDRQANGSRRR